MSFALQRYVILRHEGSATYKPGVHWDLMLEAEGVLRTWALAERPDAAAATAWIAAEKLPDHRLDYLRFEGEIAGDRGTVARWDAGHFEVVLESAQRLEIRLSDGQLRGLATLAREAESGGGWRFAFKDSGP